MGQVWTPDPGCGGNELSEHGEDRMAALLSAVADVFRDTSAAVWRAGFAALARVAQPAGAALLVFAGVAKLLAIGQHGFVRLPVVGIVSAPLATSIAVVEVVAGLWLAHAGRRRVLRVFACLYGLLALLALSRSFDQQRGSAVAASIRKINRHRPPVGPARSE